MKFFKENSSFIARLIITHIGMSVFGLVIFLATNLQGDNIMLIASLLSIVFYAVLAYSTMWEYGSKDKPAIDAGRMEFRPSKAFLASLVAEAFGIFLIIAYYVSSLFIETSEIAVQIYAVSFMLLYVVESCVSGIMLFFNHLYQNVLINSLCFLICPIVISAVSAFGYAMGAKDLKIIPVKKATK